MLSIPFAETSRLLHLSDADWDLSSVAKAMEDDCVVLISNVSRERADLLVSDVAERFRLSEQLKFQAALASIAPHRENVGRSFMTVNRRNDYEFITPHAEGTPNMGIQLASFYCEENSTDGGYTLLFNRDDHGAGWSQMRLASSKVDLSASPLSRTEIDLARSRLGLILPDAALTPDDEVLREIPSPLPGRHIFRVLSRIKPIVSTICGSAVHTYWDNAGSVDHSACEEFIGILRHLDLLKIPDGCVPLETLDNARERRIWRSGVSFADLFKAIIVRKLQPGDLILQNNLTWAHGVSNWTPSSGVRRVVAAFA